MKTNRSQVGFTLVEVLVSLAISALLLVSLALAFNASAMNYQENQETVEVVSSARQALTRMTTQLRTGGSISLGDSNSVCAFDTSGGQSISYEYESSDDTLYLVDDDVQIVLCQNVTALNFAGTLTGDATDYRSIQISMTVETGNTQYPLSAAVVIRRNLEN